MGDMVIAIIFEESDDPVRLAEVIERAQKVAADVPDVAIKLTKGDAAATIRFFADNGELPTDEEIQEDGNWVIHAKRELALVGNDEDYNQCIVEAVRAFARYGHSGGSAGVGIEILHDLLQFKNLTPLTDDPSEWIDQTEASGVPMWQSCRNSEAFSQDGGKTYYLLSEGGTMQNPSQLHETERTEIR